MFRLSFNSAAPTVIVILFYILVIAMAVASYKKFLNGTKTKLPILLHSLAFFLLLCAIFQPEISFTMKTKQRKPILVLIDTSLSMTAKDKKGITKIDRTREFLAKNKFFKNYTPIYYTFGSELNRIQKKDIEIIKAQQNATKIGFSVIEALKRHNEDCSGIIVISDGYENQFISWEEMKNKISVPIYTIGVGEQSSKDICISTVITNSPIYEGETLRISPIVSQYGFDGEKVSVSVRKNGSVVQTKMLELTSGFNRIDFEIPSLSQGDYLYQVSVQHGIGETNTDNNSSVFLVRVISPVIRILYVEGNLRWEYKFFKRFLESDKKLEPVFLVRVGESTFQQTGGRSIEIPSNILGSDRFLKNFHIIIFGDIDFSSFSESDLENLKNFVEKNGGVLFMGGENFLKGLNRQPLRDLLPAVFTGEGEPFIYGPLKISAGDGAKSIPIFEDLQQLPVLDRINKVGNVKPGAAILFESPECDHAPIVISTTAPIGKCVFVGTDSTWKWYYGVDQTEKAAYEKFWGRILRFLCTPENYLGTGQKVPEILLDKRIYAKNEAVDIKFLLKNGKIHYTAYVVNPDGSNIDLKITDDHATFVPEKEGFYIVCAQGEEKMINKKEFIVTAMGSEVQDPGRNTIYLKKLAEISGGSYFDIEKTDRLGKILSIRRTVVKKNLAVSQDNEKYFLSAIFVLLSICWFLRRRDNIL
ncbi:MAG: VWA domain-containing protein [Candidatus Omnitrophica bacterium]|nr:VWA domain-containing protein [Candidatus Omnitrophota bacterium]